MWIPLHQVFLVGLN
jgi:hypothetical protein